MQEDEYNWKNVREAVSNIINLSDDELERALLYVCKKENNDKERLELRGVLFKERDTRVSKKATIEAEEANKISRESKSLSLWAIWISILVSVANITVSIILKYCT